jgi:hypothetical protein
MTDAVGSSTLDFPEHVEDYILIIKDDCKKTNELLEIVHPDIEFVCKNDVSAEQRIVLEEQFEKRDKSGLYFPEDKNKEQIVNGKKQLYYCERTESQFLDNTNLKLYEYLNGEFKEISFRPFIGFVKKPPNCVFIKRSERVDYPDNFPVKNDNIQLSDDDRKQYFDNMIKEYENSKYRVYGGGKRSKRSKKQPKKKRKSTKRRRGTRKRANKKR